MLIGMLALVTMSAAQMHYELDEDFEAYGIGATDIAYFEEQNCRAITGCGNCYTDVPLVISDQHARHGTKSLRFERNQGDQTLTGASYCGYRNEISGHNHAFADIGDHVWIGFSFRPTDYWKDKWSQDNVHVFQFKNIDAGGGGNQRGSIKSHRVDGQYWFEVSGLGDVSRVRPDAWNDIVLHLWYKTSGGRVDAWINGDSVMADVDFPDKDKCYVKFGSYSDDLEPGTPTIGYYDDIRVLETASDDNHYADVDPSRGDPTDIRVGTCPALRTDIGARGVCFDIRGRVLRDNEPGDRLPLGVAVTRKGRLMSGMRVPHGW